MGKLSQRISSTGLPYGRLVFVAMAMSCTLPAQNPQSLAHRESMRRFQGVEEAQMLLEKGDEAYQKRDYPTAIEAYSGALDQLPDAPISSDLRQAAADRYALASVEQGKVLVRKGDVAGAKTLVDRVLQENVAPEHPAALTFRAQLDDPIRTNPVIDSQHAKNVDQVRRLLYSAQGAYELGKYDEATKLYQDILRIDPTNTAARRGMQQIAQAKADYSRTAYDHRRAEMLADVDKQWETSLSPFSVSAPDLPLGEMPVDALAPDIDTLLDQIIIQQVALEQATISEAIDYLRVVSKLPDQTTSPVNFTVNLGDPDLEPALSIQKRRFDLQLNRVPLRQVLKIVTEMTRTVFKTDGYSVVIRPAGSDSDTMVERVYRVPPDFLTSMASNSGDGQQNADPFAETNNGTTLLTSRMTIQQAFEAQGVVFGEGAFAKYYAGNTMLRVRNTPNYQDMIEQIIDTVSQTEPVLVSVKVTMIRTQKENLEELGFDWLLTPIALGDDVFAGGGTVGSTIGRRARDFTPTMPNVPNDPTATVTDGVVTNGLRSGQFATTPSSIDQLMANPNRDIQNLSVAPGILSLTGLFSDGQAQVIMRGMSQHKNVDIMSQPSVVTRSGQQATVDVLDFLYYPEEYEPPEIPTNVGVGGQAPVTPATPTSFASREVGMSLNVLPVADQNKRYVDITLQPSFSELDGFVNYGSPINTVVPTLLGGSQTVTLTENSILMPVFSDHRTNNQLTIADGATLVYGGLMSDQIQKVEDKVPVLGDVPLLGKFFTNTANLPVTTAVIFMVKVELIDPTGRPYRDR